MIKFLLTYQALIREFINGAACVLFFFSVLVISVYLWDAIMRTRNLSDWRKEPGVPVGCVLWWVFGAESYRTFNVWFSYILGKSSATFTGVGIFSVSSVNSTLGYLAAGIILCVALLRGIYVFTPPAWKRQLWVYAMVGAVIFVLSPTIYNIIDEVI